LPEILVDARDLRRVFRIEDTEVEAIAAATCTIHAGDRIALYGPSGGGKSTLLALLGGLDEPTSGSIEWPALGSREELRPARVAFVFQNMSLLAPLSAVENVELPPVLMKVPAEEARARAAAALSRFDLDALAAKLPEELSGGQAQRVAVARALAARPRLILADEPSGQLDHVTAGALFDVLLSSLDASQALVVATHDVAVAERMEEVWHMDRGVLRTRASLVDHAT
jgi:putative ABC transport system ATP-binding protein/lipoprotein-releasing system ATP-binding protein